VTESFLAIQWYVIGTKRGFDVENTSLVIVHTASAAIAVLLMMGVIHRNKSTVEIFILLAKIRVVANVLLMGIAIYNYIRDFHKEGLQDAYVGFGAIVYLFRLVTDSGSAAGRRNIIFPLTDYERWLPVTQILFIVVDCFAIWRIQVFADKMEKR
ncbi:hypothetical protein MTO96_029431, partial [Rhipicephalus appendiculatus]